MAAKIEVSEAADGRFDVRVTEGVSQTSHRVTLQPEDYARLTNSTITREELIRLSFEFLLDHEPKESILAQFDLSVIRRYFPSYDGEITKRLSNSRSI